MGSGGAGEMVAISSRKPRTMGAVPRPFVKAPPHSLDHAPRSRFAIRRFSRSEDDLHYSVAECLPPLSRLCYL
jgi:hypothetical protein